MMRRKRTPIEDYLRSVADEWGGGMSEYNFRPGAAGPSAANDSYDVASASDASVGSTGAESESEAFSSPNPRMRYSPATPLRRSAAKLSAADHSPKPGVEQIKALLSPKRETASASPAAVKGLSPKKPGVEQLKALMSPSKASAGGGAASTTATASTVSKAKEGPVAKSEPKPPLEKATKDAKVPTRTMSISGYPVYTSASGREYIQDPRPSRKGKAYYISKGAEKLRDYEAEVLATDKP